MPLTNWTNISSFSGLLAEANNQTSGLFWSGMNLMIFLVLFLTLSTQFPWEAAFFSAGFVSIIISLFLMYLGLQSMLFTGIIAGGIILIFIIVMWSNRNN